MIQTKAKKCITAVVIATLALLLASGLFVYVTDPFYQYHGPWFSEGAYLTQAVYQTPGAARNLSYKDVIVGSSMTENFRASEFDKTFGWDTVKLSYSGLWTDDMRAILEQIYDSHTPEHVVLSVDMYMYMDPNSGTRVYAERPKYLYTKSILDDAPYLLSRDAVKEGAVILWQKLTGTEPDADLSYTWDYPCGLSVVMKDYAAVREADLAKNDPELAKDAFLATAAAGFANIEPVISMHPETEFYVFFPAYSMLYWDELECSGRTDAVVEAQRYLIGEFLKYDNVRMYYFLSSEVCENIDNYLDTGHYSPAINHEEMLWMRSDTFRVTKADYNAVLDTMLFKAKNYDYSQYGLTK